MSSWGSIRFSRRTLLHGVSVVNKEAAVLETNLLDLLAGNRGVKKPQSVRSGFVNAAKFHCLLCVLLC